MEHELLVYEEPENHGEELPEEVAKRMKDVDVVIAPTLKSLFHTEARKKANEEGVRVATLPTVSKEIWNTSLQADYSEVERITEKVSDMIEETDEITVKTPSGTYLRFNVKFDIFRNDRKVLGDQGNFGNLPVGEPNGFSANIEGTLVLGHFPSSPDAKKVRSERER